MILFVSGGVRSGKSGIAEQRVIEAAQGMPCYYIATAMVLDTEMAARVARHQQDRSRQWITLEAHVELDRILTQVPDRQAVLLDCLTLWASQVLFSADLNEEEGLVIFQRTLEYARRRGHYLVIVSNDLNEDILSPHLETRRYVEFLQTLHRWLAVTADSVLEVVSGHAIEWKMNGTSV